MADTTITTAVSAGTEDIGGIWGPYWSDVSKGVVVYVRGDRDLAFARTTDKGANWTLTQIVAGNVRHLSCWFDKETPGDNGTLVHICWMDADDDKVYYQTVDVSDASQGTLRTVATLTDIEAAHSNNRNCITKSRNGNLYIGYYTETEQELDFVRSVDSGANWTSRAALYEASAGNNDHALLFPANTGDDADVCALFWDRSAEIISIKMYDDSGNSWTETSVDTGVVSHPGHVNMAGSIRESDGHLLIVFHSDEDSAGDDLRTFDLTVDSIASPTVTAKTNIFTDQGESGEASVFINQQNDDVYVAYLKGGTFRATVDVVFHISADDMGTWGSEQAYSEAAADDIRAVAAGRTIGNDGGRYQPHWFNDDITDLFVNEVNDVEIVAAAVGQTIAVNQVTETNLAQSVAWAPKNRLADQVIETDLSQAIGWAPKNRLAGQVTETDVSQSVSSAKALLMGTVLETDAAQAVAWTPKNRLVNQTAETDSAQAAAVLKSALIGLVTETDLVQSIAWAPKNRLVGQITETNLAQTISILKSKLLDQVAETDLAQLIAWAPKHRLVVQVAETDLAQVIAVAGAKFIAVGQVTETDLAQAILWAPKNRLVAQATETELAQAIATAKLKMIAQALEIDTAQAMTWAPKHRLVGQVIEVDFAQIIAVVVLIGVSDVDFLLEAWGIDFVIETWDVENVLETWDTEFELE